MAQTLKDLKREIANQYAYEKVCGNANTLLPIKDIVIQFTKCKPSDKAIEAELRSWVCDYHCAYCQCVKGYTCLLGGTI